MPRRPRLIVPGMPHHVTQRGNNKQPVFDDDGDMRRYLVWMSEYCVKFNLDILAYCLMPNHVHFIIVPEDDASLSKALNAINMRYSQYRNRKNKSSGHVWQGRFFSCVMDEKHMIAAARYIERNPVRAKMIRYPWMYAWSSAKDHCDNLASSIIDSRHIFNFTDIAQTRWREFIGEEDSPGEVDTIRRHTAGGRPLGETGFIRKLESSLGINLQLLPIGRPKGKAKGKGQGNV